MGFGFNYVVDVAVIYSVYALFARLFQMILEKVTAYHRTVVYLGGVINSAALS